jgi:hypothetical protein
MWREYTKERRRARGGCQTKQFKVLHGRVCLDAVVLSVVELDEWWVVRLASAN